MSIRSRFRTDRIGVGTYYDSRVANNFDITTDDDFCVRAIGVNTNTAPSDETKYVASDGAANDNFGSSVAVGVNRIVIGAPGYNSNQGKVYIVESYKTAVGILTEKAKLTDPNGSSGDYFGSRVALGNGRIVVSAYNKNSDQGAVFIYDLNGNLLKTLNGSSAGDEFGWSIAVGCGRIVVGAPGYNSNRGRAHIYDLNGTPIRTLDATNSGDEYGRSVAVGCGRIVVGAPEYGSSAGIGYLYDLAGTVEAYRSFLEIGSSASPNGSEFGTEMEIANSRIVGYAPAYTSSYENGSVFSVFDLNGGYYSRNVEYGDGPIKIALGCGRIVVGDGSVTVGGNVGVGSARVYHWLNQFNISSFTFDDNYTDLPLNASLDANDNFGSSVAVGNYLRSGRIVIGAPGDDDNGSGAGAIYIYDTPRQTHYLDILEER